MARTTQIVKASGIKRDTEKAWLIETNMGGQVWLPKSQVAVSYFYNGHGHTLIIEMPTWLYAKQPAGAFADFNLATIGDAEIVRVNRYEDWAAVGQLAENQPKRKATRKGNGTPATHEHRGWTMRIYKARSSYDHYRVSWLAAPNGKRVSDADLAAVWGLKYAVYNDPVGAETFEQAGIKYYAGSNIGATANETYAYVCERIDRVMAGKTPKLTNDEVNAIGGKGIVL